MTIRLIGSLIAAAASFVLALLVTLMPLDIEPAPKSRPPATIPAPCQQGGVRC